MPTPQAARCGSRSSGTALTRVIPELSTNVAATATTPCAARPATMLSASLRRVFRSSTSTTVPHFSQAHSRPAARIPQAAPTEVAGQTIEPGSDSGRSRTYLPRRTRRRRVVRSLMVAPVREHSLRPSLSVWQAVGISVALMAPSMAANINPQGTAGLVGRATPLAFFLAAIAVLLIAYVFVRLCQYYRHAGSVYVFTGATLGSHAGAIAGLSLMGTYVFYALVTSSAAGIFGASFLDIIGVWNDQPTWAGFVVGGVALAFALMLAVLPAKRAAEVLLSAEGITVALIVVVALVVLVKLLAGTAPGDQGFTMKVFSVPDGTSTSTLFLGIVFGLLSFAGFEAASTLGEETHHPQRDIPRAILWTAIFGGIYFTVVTAIEMMGFGTDAAGVDAFASSPALMGDLGTSYIGAWVGNLITLGACVSAFACCLACVVGASRLLFAITRDLAPGHRLGHTGANATPAAAAVVVCSTVFVMAVICAVFFGA